MKVKMHEKYIIVQWCINVRVLILYFQESLEDLKERIKDWLSFPWILILNLRYEFKNIKMLIVYEGTERFDDPRF